MQVSIGDRVVVNGTWPGTLRFLGSVQFSHGVWAGVELDEAAGQNDGKMQGRRYFECGRNHGIFVKKHQLTRELMIEGQSIPAYVESLQERHKETQTQLEATVSVCLCEWEGGGGMCVCVCVCVCV